MTTTTTEDEQFAAIFNAGYYRILTARRAAIAFGESIGIKFVEAPSPPGTPKHHNGITYIGKYDGGDDLEHICHEIAHYQVASADRRHLDNYGNTMKVIDIQNAITDTDTRNIYPECIEEGRASILGDLHRQQFDPKSVRFVFGYDGRILYKHHQFRKDDAERWLIKHGFIVDGQATNKLNDMTIFNSFAEYF